MPSRWLRTGIVALLLGTLFAVGGDARADLLDYVNKPDDSFAWKLKEKSAGEENTVYTLELTSQTWHGIVWKHSVQVFLPKDVKPGATMLLYNTGGGPSLTVALFGLEVAKRTRAPVAVLYDIPNQPLLDGKREDALIAETFVRALETKDFSWPLLAPMVKSVVRCMDALQAFAREEWKTEVKHFVVSGASKRGWTAWLTAATQDPRVVAIVPMVIDTLNMQEQMAHQKESFGRYSEMIRDYTARGLVPLPDGEDAKKLWAMVDPYSYRDKITIPKLLILGNNDRYWTADALNLYWSGLKGDTYITYVPNAGHNLVQLGVPPERNRARMLNALSAFSRAQVTGKPLPKLSWKHDDVDGRLRLTVQCDPPPKGARLWVATAPTRDFREATWKEKPAQVDGKTVVGQVAAPVECCLAFYAEMDYELDGIPYTLCTQLRIAAAKAE